MSRTIAVAGSISLVLWSLLSWLTCGVPGAPGNLAHGFHYEVLNGDKPTLAYLGLHGMLCIVLAIVLRTLYRTGGAGGFRLAIGFAIVFRVVLVPSVPIHESDFYRYLWDGKVARSGINPYRFKPSDLAEAGKVQVPGNAERSGRHFSERDRQALDRLDRVRRENPELFARISHPEVRTVYPPLAQGVFAVSNFLFGDSLTGLKFLLTAFDLATIAVVVAILRALGRNRLWVMVYAWNPLVLKEFANSAHFDAVPVFFTVLALWLSIVSRSKWKTALVLAGGTLAKFFSAILLPVLLAPPSRKSVPACLVFAGAVALGFVPFVLWDGIPAKSLLGGLGAYSERWHFLGGVFMPLWLLFSGFEFHSEWWGDGQIPAKVVCGLLLVSVIAVLSLRRKKSGSREGLARDVFLAIAALFVLSPTAFPWYYTWVLPFVCLFPSGAWIGLSFLLPLSYLDFQPAPEVAAFLRIPALWWVIWAPFGVLLLVRKWRCSLFPAHDHPVTAGDNQNGAGDLEELETFVENEDAAD